MIQESRRGPNCAEHKANLNKAQDSAQMRWVGQVWGKHWTRIGSPQLNLPEKDTVTGTLSEVETNTQGFKSAIHCFLNLLKAEPL